MTCEKGWQSNMIREMTAMLTNRQNLDVRQAKNIIDEIMSGKTSEVQTAAFLAALATKGETIDEITGCAEGMREKMTKVHYPSQLFEIVGTGGDGSNSFNISTTASIVIAAAGVKVSKHGNRAASSKSGAADCLEALGVNINVSPEQCTALLDKVGICFFFAQNYHKAMKFVAPVRKEMGIRTIFNLLGPLTNPATPNRQILGVYSKDRVETLAHVLANLGLKHGMVVHGEDGMDEISVSSATTICEFKDGKFKTYQISPEDFELSFCKPEDLVGGSPEENAQITREILEGKTGAKRDAVLLNAGAGIYIAGKVESLEAGVSLAAEVINTGKAMKKLEAFILESNA